MKKILFVCMGNICRSPTAHAVMQHLVDQRGLSNDYQIDSAGTHAYHVGEASDSRARELAASRDVDMEYIRARKISISDYDSFDYILAMDKENLKLINYYAPENHAAQVALFLDFAVSAGKTSRTEVPDPYYGGAEGFKDVFNLVTQGCESLVAELSKPSEG